MQTPEPPPKSPRTFPAEEHPEPAAWSPAPEAWGAGPGNDIVHGPLNRVLLRTAGPAILAKALFATLALVDVFWVGRLGAAATAAVNTGFFTSWILQAATALTAIGILAHVSRAVGSGDREGAGRAAAQGLVAGVLLGTILGGAVWFAAPLLFDLLGTAADVREPGIVYLRILFLAAPLSFTVANCESIMRAAGNTRTPLLVMGGMVLVNGVLDPLLIFGLGPFPRLEVMGAALATLLAQLLGVLFFAARAFAGDRNFPLQRSALRRLDWRLASRLVRVGMPPMAIGALFSLIYLFLSGVAARLGTLELAVLGLGNRTEALTYLVSSGFAAATAAVVGQNLGAGNPERAARAAWRSAAWMAGYGTFVGAVLIAWPQQVLGLFTADAAVLEVGTTYTRILGLCHGLMAVEIVIENAFAGAGDTLPPMLISVPINLLRVPIVLFLVYQLEVGILGIGWLLSITAGFRGVIAMIWFRRGGWKNKRL